MDGNKYMEEPSEVEIPPHDGDGVIIEAEASPVHETAQTAPPQPQRQVGQYAPGGGVIPGPSGSAGQFVDLLEDGQLSHELHEDLKQLAAQIRNVANATGSKAKGSITLKLDIAAEGDALTIQGKIATKAPELPRRRSIMWQDDSGSFTRFPPNQTQMFGTAPIRRVG